MSVPGAARGSPRCSRHAAWGAGTSPGCQALPFHSPWPCQPSGLPSAQWGTRLPASSTLLCAQRGVGASHWLGAATSSPDRLSSVSVAELSGTGWNQL